MGKIRFKVSAKTHQDSQFIEGNCTAFSKTVKPGDCIVIKGERRLVKEIRSDTLLVINGAFPASAIDGSVGQFVDFKVERKPTSNGYVDCYSNMYERYPIDSYIQDNNEVRASPATALHIILGISGQQLADSNYSERFSRYIMEAFSDLLKTTNKPALSLKNFSLGTDSIDNLDIIQFCRRSKPRPIGKWLIQMACLLPIQIAIAMDNHFVPLKDGVITDMDATCGVGASLATVSEAITFGWYESVFNFYGDHEIKAVSSMGEQSTGCLDVPGADSKDSLCRHGFRRSPELGEDTARGLVLDTLQRRGFESHLIQKQFRSGKRYLVNVPSFSDVPKQDRVGIVHEFRSKFTQIVSEEGEDNFISRLHKGQMSILPWPVFNDSGFYSTLSADTQLLIGEEPFSLTYSFEKIPGRSRVEIRKGANFFAHHQNHHGEAEGLRLVFSGQQYGSNSGLCHTLSHQASSCLGCRGGGTDVRAPQEDDTVTFNDLFDGTGIIINDHPIMSDCGLNLSPLPGNSFRDFSSKLRAFFEKHAQERESTPIDADWYALYSAFVKHMIARRIRRARQWFSANTARFPSDHPEISAASYELEQESDRLVAAWSLCGLTCGNCSLRCLEQRDHSGHHDCFTDHRCKYGCEFAQDHRSSQTPPCSMPAGHDGAHVCTESEHFCGEPCALNGKRNCQGICMMQIGHGGESHLCASRVHYCGEACSLSNVADSTSGSQFSCKNMCIVPYEEPHTVHKCENMMACPLRCCLPQCNKKCSSNDHFHALLNPSEAHICGDDHQCVEECEAKGICEIQIQPKAQEEHYVNMHGTFAYTKSWIQLIYIYIESSNGSFCETKCPYCEYYCTLPYGHPQMEHETAHGNFNNLHFNELSVIQVETLYLTISALSIQATRFKLFSALWTTNSSITGSPSTRAIGAVASYAIWYVQYNPNTQTAFCKDLGRHKHIDYCQSAASTTCSGEGIQHISEKINPDPDRPKDFVKHGLYWKRMGFKDPYSKDDQEFFSKCDALCCGEEHQIKATQAASSAEGSNAITPTKSYCELPLFHAPLPDGSAPPNGGVGYVSVDGHYFKCQNPAMIGSDFHIIFVIDRSGSMASTDCKPLPNTPVERQLRITHNNRLGAVYDAVHRFVHTRQSTLRNRALGGATSTSPSNSNDTVSMVLFDDKVVTAFANETLVGFGGVVSEMQKHLPRGGTSFGVGIKQATDVCVQHHDQRRVPVIIFLSDGGCTDNFQNAMGLQQLFDSTASVGVKPFLITVRFGNDMSGAQMLRSMADYAEKHHKNTASRQTSSAFNSSRSFKCAYFEALDEFQLAECFTGLAKSLKEYKPALIRR
ncbi:hypothetical protein BC936DRAFT_137866 [Jimgerdemannia flammicorona]|uniref:VWFA domain-containing protein n=2 Tax=Jimgerdemannia flammicorona TaxID=994334 RepID=A0A433CWI2_9FUNG|nr:hypothetical protein BC936DRAFT_137866 [Jimgerdemannia flammicorona]